MTYSTAVVSTGRYGDVISVLPCVRDIAIRDGKCAVVVSAEFSSVLDGCSYVESVIVSSGFTDIAPAIDHARKMFPNVLVAKVNERSIGITALCESFTQESWKQLGYLDQYETLPLVFDLRDKERERKLLEMVSDGRPMILMNTSGKSAPYPYRKELMKLFPRTHNVVELGEIKAHRIYDLLGLMDAAELLVTGDTSTMHLAAASGVPVFNLIGEIPTRWHGTKTRNNSVLALRYGESLERMKELENVPWKWKPRTWHVWSDYDMKGDTLRRHLFAKSTWKDTGWIDFPVKDNPRVIKDPMREVPFIKDLVNAAVRAAGPKDFIILSNADSCIAPTAVERIKKAFETADSFYSYRRDFDFMNGPKSTEEISAAERYPGCDLFGFSVEWWTKHQALFPDMATASEGWDWCLRVLMQRTEGFEFTDLVLHQKHQNTWEQPQYRTSLPSQIHNRNLARPFLAQYGVPMG